MLYALISFKMSALRIFYPKSNSLLIGVCFPYLKHNISRIKVVKNEFNPRILMFFPEYFDFYAYDPNKICKRGDTVLIRECAEKKSSKVTHEVVEVIYPLGDIVDPITGKKVCGTQFRDEMDEIESVYGDSETKFRYEKAPKRGWQRDIRDFSHREFYNRYHEFDKGDENESQPYSLL